MRATLIHNHDAGPGDGPSLKHFEIVEAIERLAWDVTPLDRSQLESALVDPGDVVIVAGGDGTVGKVAKRLAGTGIPIAVVPMGTANNVARTLGLHLDPLSAILSLQHAVARDVDLGVVTAGGREERFLEGFGAGVLALVMAERATRQHRRLRCAFGLLATELERYEPVHARIEVDGRDLSGDFLLVSVMNLRSLGPTLRLAPEARYDDGELDLALVRPDDRGPFVANLLRAARGDGDVALPPFETHRGKRLRIGRCGKWAHVDDRPRRLAGHVEVRIEPRAVRFLVPVTAGS